MRTYFLSLEQDLFDLAGEYVYAPDLEHIICSSAEIFHSCSGSSALARLVHKTGDISCAVSDKRQSFLGKACNHQLALFACGENFACFGVDYLCNKMIFIDVHSAKLGTFARNTGADKLAHTIVLGYGKIIAVKLVHLISHSFGKQLASDKSCFELQVSFGVKSHLSSHLADTKSIGRCCNQQS